MHKPTRKIMQRGSYFIYSSPIQSGYDVFEAVGSRSVKRLSNEPLSVCVEYVQDHTYFDRRKNKITPIRIAAILSGLILFAFVFLFLLPVL